MRLDDNCSPYWSIGDWKIYKFKHQKKNNRSFVLTEPENIVGLYNGCPIKNCAVSIIEISPLLSL